MYWYYVLCNLRIFFIVSLFFCIVTILAICIWYILDVGERWRTKVLRIVIILGVLLILALCFIPSPDILIHLMK